VPTLTDLHDSRVPAPVAVVGLLVIAAAVGFGFAAGSLGWYVILAIGALTIVAAVFYQPLFGIVLLVATIPIENMLVFSGLGTGRAIGMAVFGAWFVRKIVYRESWRNVVTGGFFPISIGFLVWVLLSLLWAEHPTVVKSGFVRLSQMVVLALIIIDLADSRAKLDLIAKTLVLATLAAASVTLYQSQILGVRRAGNDVAGGINETAVLLVTVLPLGFYVLRSGGSVLWRIAGALFLPVIAVSVLATLSRMNMILLPVVALLLFLITFRERSARGWLVVLAVASVVGATLFTPWDKVRERAATIDTYLQGTINLEDEQTDTSPRGYHLLVGLQIARDHPLRGVGYGNYGYYFRDVYQFQIPGATKLYTSPRNPHSAYIGILADLGAVGLSLWVGLLGVAVIGVVRAWRLGRRLPGRQLVPLAETVGLMLALHVFAYGFYTSHQVEKLLWVIMAMSVVLGRLAAREAVESETQRPGFGPSKFDTGYARPELTVL